MSGMLESNLPGLRRNIRFFEDGTGSCNAPIFNSGRHGWTATREIFGKRFQRGFIDEIAMKLAVSEVSWISPATTPNLAGGSGVTKKAMEPVSGVKGRVARRRRWRLHPESALAFKYGPLEIEVRQDPLELGSPRTFREPKSLGSDTQEFLEGLKGRTDLSITPGRSVGQKR